ncbi:MAG TPA: cyclase family protein [Dehalococcoidia bacterium]|nr:cyclase family protein [Dehalococcoidia bacterium]
MSGPAKPISRDEVDALFQKVSNWGRWGEDDQLGALNLITPAKRLQAAELVIDGITVSCALPLNTTGSGENPRPVVHLMVGAGDIERATSSSDYFAIASHGMAHTHLDALCHIFYRGQMYNGRPASMVTSAGALANSIEAGKDGVVSRGVLLDIPTALGKEWLEPGEAIYVEDLELAETKMHTRVEEGDILLIRTGRHQRREKLGPAQGLAGLHASTLPWLHQRGVAVLGCDGVSDVTPSGMEGGMGLPIHMIAIPAMGVHLIDNMGLDELAATCDRLDRYEFMLTLAPLKLLKGTASPVNPIALF